MNDLPPRFTLGPVWVSAVDVVTLIESVCSALDLRRGRLVSYLNAHAFNLLSTDAAFAKAFSEFDIVFCDGVGAKLGCAFLGAPLSVRMTPPDFINELLAEVETRGHSAYFLGDQPGIATRAAQRVNARIAGAVAGAHHGYFGREQEAELVNDIRQSGARIVFVGLGMPNQEHLILRLKAELPEHVLFAAGALFRWLSGVDARGPAWLTDNGLEWACRLLGEPRRLAGRYLIGLPQFGIRLLRHRMNGRAFERLSPS